MSANLKLCCIGDISLAYINKDRKEIVCDSLKNEIDANDVILANMEYVVAKNVQRSHYLCLADDPDTCDLLSDTGINVVTLANNHILDYGEEGIVSSMACLQERGIACCGAGLNELEAKKPCIITKKRKRIAIFGRVLDDSFVNVSPIVAGATKAGAALLTELDIEWCISEYRSTVDVMIMYVHWGMQGMHGHSKYVHQYGKLLKESGFDIVVGSHSHIPGGGDFDNSIFYGLGNFYFAPVPCEDNYGGLLYGPAYKKNRLSEIVFLEYGDHMDKRWSVKFVSQNDEDVVTPVEKVRNQKLITRIFDVYKDYSWFRYQIEWRIRISQAYYHYLAVAVINRKYRRIIGLLSRNGINYIANMIIPKTLG